MFREFLGFAEMFNPYFWCGWPSFSSDLLYFVSAIFHRVPQEGDWCRGGSRYVEEWGGVGP